jgi:hypothetical protein
MTMKAFWLNFKGICYIFPITVYGFRGSRVQGKLEVRGERLEVNDLLPQTSSEAILEPQTTKSEIGRGQRLASGEN